MENKVILFSASSYIHVSIREENLCAIKNRTIISEIHFYFLIYDMNASHLQHKHTRGVKRTI